MKFSLYIITHKKIENIVPENRVKLLVGAYNKEKIDSYLCDDSFENNISHLNSSFCELTGLYYIWKNDDSDVVGLEHYRRIFVSSKFYVFRFPFLKEKKIKKILEEYDIILPKRYYNELSVKDFYNEEHCSEDLEIVRDIINELYPEYLDDFEAVMNSHYSYFYNMFIGKKSLINDYCKWLFDILFEAQTRIDLKNKDSYQSRVFGFLSERLFNVYLQHHKSIKICEKQVEFIETSPIRTQIRRLKKKL